MNTNISPNWSAEERLRFIGELTNLQLEHIGGKFMVGVGEPISPIELTEIIHMVSSRKAEFLENNRERIFRPFS